MKNIFSRRSRRHAPQQKEGEQKPFFPKSNDTAFFQPKLKVGQPGDKYEKEADAVANKVVSKGENTPTIQNKEITSVQRYMTNAEYDEQGTNTERIEEDKRIQEKPEVQRMGQEEEESVQTQMEEEQVQTQEEEEESVQAQAEEEEPEVQQQQEEEEMPVQTKGNGSSNTASPQLSNRIKQASGGGRVMDPKVRAEMESSFGRDFSDVHIHTDQEALEMNKELGAQAFTHGKDIYFNSGKYHPETATGKHLLAHELTHVVQQNAQAPKASSQISKYTHSENLISRKGDEDKREALPSFDKMWSSFPTGSAEDVKKFIGGKVNYDWIKNTCAIRMSRVLNYTGHPIPFTKTSKDQLTVSGADKKWYFFRISTLRPFIEKKFGAPDVKFTPPYDMNELKKHKGIILFDVDVWKDATGHFTLWNGTRAADKSFFKEAKAVYLWIQ